MYFCTRFWVVSSVGSERCFHTAEVTGSNPVRPTKESHIVALFFCVILRNELSFFSEKFISEKKGAMPKHHTHDWIVVCFYLASSVFSSLLKKTNLPSSRLSTMMVPSFSTLPSKMNLESSLRIFFWMTRFSGRAPYIGS